MGMQLGFLLLTFALLSYSANDGTLHDCQQQLEVFGWDCMKSAVSEAPGTSDVSWYF
jgi:hypothetical protein